MAFSGGAHELRREFTAGRDSELPKRTGTSASDAINGTLRVLGVGIIVASALVIALRHALVRRGQITPLSMKASVVPPAS